MPHRENLTLQSFTCNDTTHLPSPRSVHQRAPLLCVVIVSVVVSDMCPGGGTTVLKVGVSHFQNGGVTIQTDDLYTPVLTFCSGSTLIAKRSTQICKIINKSVGDIGSFWGPFLTTCLPALRAHVGHTAYFCILTNFHGRTVCNAFCIDLLMFNRSYYIMRVTPFSYNLVPYF